MKFIYLAALWGILTWAIQILQQIADAYGVTVSTELCRISQKLLGLVLILTLFYFELLNLTAFFIYHYIIMFFLGALVVWILNKKGHTFLRNWKLPLKKVKTYIEEFFNYCHPLFIFSLVMLICGVLDRWLLQKFGGSVEQGYFGLSFQIGLVCFIFTGAMTPLIMREFAIAYGKNDLIEMARLFRQYIPMLYAIAAYFGCFIAVEAEKATYIIGGEKFYAATPTVMIMSFYPIHQTYGQLSSSVLIATGQTKLIRNISIFIASIGLPLVYFLLAPPDLFGLATGSVGLALKMVLIQFIGVNIQLFFNAQMLGLRFWKYFVHQLFCIFVFLSVAITSESLVDIFFNFSNTIISFFFSGLLYTIFVGTIALLFPILFGLHKGDIKYIWGKLSLLFLSY